MVGSSRKTTARSPARLAARSRRRRIPPEQVATCRPATSASPDTFLQNPLGNPRASKPVLECFPPSGPNQFAVAGAFGRTALWGYAALGLAWPAALAAIGLVIFRARTRTRTRHGR